MSEWWVRLMPLVRKRRRVGLPHGVAAHSEGVATTTEPPMPDDADTLDDTAFPAWLLQSGTHAGAPMAAAESQALAALEAVLRSARNAAELLPRAPAVIPKLMSMLRQDERSLAAISQRVASDVTLSAEVLRQAGSAAYRSARDADLPPPDLHQALALLGVDGLRAVIARVVLRPVFDAQTGRLAGRAAARAWRHAELEAHLAAQHARAHGVDPFDAYLGGLVHGSGWTVAWRTLDRLAEPLGLPASEGFVCRLLPLTDALFGKVVAAWQLTPSLTSLCRELRGGAPLHTRPLGAVLQHARRQALSQMLAGEAA